MVKKFKTFGPQLVFAEQTAGSVVALTNEQKLSLYKKSQKSGISTDILEEVYRRGYSIWNESFGQTAEQFAFDRVNSFIAGGFAADLDNDLLDEGIIKTIKRGLQGWSGDTELPLTGSANKPKDVVARTKASDTERLKALASGSGMTKGSPADLQQRVAKKELAKRVNEDVKEPTGDLKKACWKGYTAVGMKMKNGRKVPNCVPVKEEQISEAGIGNPKTLTPGAAKEWREKHRLAFAKKRAAGKPEPTKDELRKMMADAIKNTATMQKEALDIHKGKHFKTTETVEKQSKNPNDPDSRFDGTKSGKNVYQKATPGQPVTEASEDEVKNLMNYVKNKKEQEEMEKVKPKVSSSKADEPRKFEKTPSQTSTIVKRVVKEEVLNERGADAKGYYRSTEAGAGLTRKGAKHFGIKTAVTTPPSKLKPGSKAAKRRKSFCARMGGMKGPMKDEKGRPTRKAMSLRRWNCEETINELSVPAGTTGKRAEVSTPMVAIRMASGKIEKHPPGKSGSSGGGDE